MIRISTDLISVTPNIIINRNHIVSIASELNFENTKTIIVLSTNQCISVPIPISTFIRELRASLTEPF